MALFSKEALQRVARAEKALPRRKILIVDDEEHNLTTLKFALPRDFEVLTATDGQSALELLQNHPNPSEIEMIISDQRMPRMTGVEFLARSIAITPRTVRIILTGFTDVEAIMDSINQARIYKFVLKPFDKSDLLLTIRRGFELHDLEARNRNLLDALDRFNSQFIRQVREELQNVAGSQELLAQSLAALVSPEQSELLEQTGTSTNGLIDLLNRATELSYVYTGTRSLAREQLDVVALTQETADAFLAQQAPGTLSLQYHWSLNGAAEEDAHLLLEADGELLRKALLELLANASTYAEKPARVRIRGSVYDNRYCIQIEDDGIGLEAEGGAALLAPFARGRSAARYHPEGLGVGLTTAVAQIEAMGGKVYFPAQKAGTTVVIALPLPGFDAGPLHEESPVWRIAVHQESEEYRYFLRQALAFEGHEVRAFESPETLLRGMADWQPDAVLLDARSDDASLRHIAEGIAGQNAGSQPRVVLLGAAAPAGDGETAPGGVPTEARPTDSEQVSALLERVFNS